ncbi:MAG: hypothetical protein WD876_02005 [Candidatus Pacearchaeota archaeon]
MEFWNSQLTEKSWKLLQELKKKYNFILIGGWATYLWVRQQKSKDIDIVVEIKELQKLKSENLSKNHNLKKYEIKSDEIDVDIYVSYFSKLTIAPENLKKYIKKIEGFNVVSSEVLIILKQGAYEDRKNSVKGEKDKIDIMSLLFFSDVDIGAYKSILKEYSLDHYARNLIDLLKNFKDYDYLNLTPREFKFKKRTMLDEFKKS